MTLIFKGLGVRRAWALTIDDRPSSHGPLEASEDVITEDFVISDGLR